MTIGERIAKIRKENNLSQEAFGEALGVTRQAISKWEADANIPDVDKLMTMSRLYGVSVGYILGMEEDGPKNAKTIPDPAAGMLGTGGAGSGSDRGAGNGEDPHQLTEEQLRMVEEIVKRYIDALPKTEAGRSGAENGASTHAEPSKPKGKRRLLWKVLGVAALIGLVIYFQNTIQSMKNQYQNLQSNLYVVQNALNNQSDEISYQIKEILESQNNLLVDSGYEILSYDLAADTVTLSMYAEPKTYTDNMKIYFGTNSDGEESTVESTADGHRFSAEITCALTDSISIFARVERDGVIETQIMEYLGGLHYTTMPDFRGDGGLHLWNDEIGTEMTRIQTVLFAEYSKTREPKMGDAKVAHLLSVLYVNMQEYATFELILDEGKYRKGDTEDRVVYSVPVEIDIPLKEGDTLTFTTRMTDNYGREFESVDNHFVVEEGVIEMGGYPELNELQRKK